jgi:hypothetical protein
VTYYDMPNKECVGLEPCWAADNVPDATGATAGIPGTFTPPGTDIPKNLAGMTGIVASPATPWTTGQYVQTQLTGAPGRVTWSGSSWVGGVAP